MNDIVQDAQQWLSATDGKRSHPALLIQSLVTRIKELEQHTAWLENQLYEADELVAYLEAKLEKFQ